MQCNIYNIGYPTNTEDTHMNKIPFDTEAATKATFNNASQVLDLALSKSAELLEKNIQAAKETIERHADYAKDLRGARDIEEFAKVQERISKSEAKAIEGFSKEIYKLSTEAAADLADVSDNNKKVADDLISDSFERIADSIPNGNAQPYGNIFREMFRNQAEAYRTFNDLVEKTVAAQRSNFSTVAQTVSEAGAKAAKPAGKGKRG